MNKTDPFTAGGRQDLMTLMDLMNTASRNVCFATAGLAIGTGANTSVKVANTVTYLSAGVFKSKSTAEVAFTTTTDDIPANAASVQERMWYVCVNAAGTLSMVAGAIASGTGNALLPERSAVADGLAIIGAVRIAVAAGAPGAGTNFVANTTALNDARLVGSAATYYNLGYVAPRFDATQ